MEGADLYGVSMGHERVIYIIGMNAVRTYDCSSKLLVDLAVSASTHLYL